MPFLGKQPTAGFSTIVKDDLTPDGSTTAFTLSKNVASANDIAVFVGNVRQEPTDAYSVSGTTLTMSAAPASGVNFYVLHIAGTVESSVVPAAGTTVPGNFGMSGNLDVDGTATIDGSVTTTGDITASNSSGHRSLTVKGNSTTNYQGGSLLLANEGMDTNYGGTYLYHHKAGGTGTDDAGFNISQRTASGGYVSNIWNVDYKNNVHSWYIPNGGASGAVAMRLDANGYITKPIQPGFNASSGSAQFLTSSGVVVFGDDSGSPQFDTSGNYNTTNGRFTAPVSGVYLVTFSIYKEINQTMDCNIRINGGTVGEIRNFTTNGNHEEFNGTWIWYLNANDYIDIYNEQPYLHLNSTMSQFAAVLLG